MEAIELIGRLLFVGAFLMSGISHLTKRGGMVAYAETTRNPAPAVTVPLSGVVEIVSCLLIALGAWPDLGALLLAFFLIPTAFYMHAFWKVEDPQMRQNQQIHFMKNVSLAGAAIALFAFYATSSDEFWLITGPLF